MGRKRRNGYEQKPYENYESLSDRKDHKYFYKGKWLTDTTTNLCYTMLDSPAFKDLSARQRMLYVYAKMQRFGARSKPSGDYDIPEYKVKDSYKGEKYFYLNHHLLTEVFCLYPKTNKKRLYDDIKALIEHGFIEKDSDGKANQKRSIYKYSDKWKNWNE